jgi:hypothetical protein
MRTALALCALVVLAWGSVSPAQERELGECDASAQREKRSVQYNVESRSDAGSHFSARLPCSTRSVIIKSCAVIATQGKKIQRFCSPPDRPEYYEYMDVVEYWAAPGERPADR